MQTIGVLVADDTAETRVSVCRLLRFVSGFEIVDEAVDGKDAVEKTLRLRPDCVLLDVNMPVMDGIGAAKALSHQAPQIAIVMMSVFGEREMLHRAAAAGAHDFLIKPFDAESLCRAIRQAVTARRGYCGDYSRSADRHSADLFLIPPKA